MKRPKISLARLSPELAPKPKAPKPAPTPKPVPSPASIPDPEPEPVAASTEFSLPRAEPGPQVMGAAAPFAPVAAADAPPAAPTSSAIVEDELRLANGVRLTVAPTLPSWSQRHGDHDLQVKPAIPQAPAPPISVPKPTSEPIPSPTLPDDLTGESLWRLMVEFDVPLTTWAKHGEENPLIVSNTAGHELDCQIKLANMNGYLGCPRCGQYAELPHLARATFAPVVSPTANLPMTWWGAEVIRNPKTPPELVAEIQRTRGWEFTRVGQNEFMPTLTQREQLLWDSLTQLTPTNGSN